MKVYFILFTVLVIFFSITTTGHTGETFFGITGGSSYPTGDRNQSWNTGFCIGGNLFTYSDINPSVLLSCRLAYNRWSIDADKYFGHSYADNYSDVSGSLSIVEISPAARIITTKDKTKNFDLFAQFGFGYYLWDSKIEATDISHGTNTKIFYENSEKEFAGSFGGGIIIANKFEIMPLFHVIFREGKNNKFGTLNLGILIGN